MENYAEKAEEYHYDIQLGIILKNQKWQDINFITHATVKGLKAAVGILARLLNEEKYTEGFYQHYASGTESAIKAVTGESITMAPVSPFEMLTSSETKKGEGVRIRIMRQGWNRSTPMPIE